MKQLLQNVSTGEVTVDEVPPPQRGPASLLVATRYSLISAGHRARGARDRARLAGRQGPRPSRPRAQGRGVRAHRRDRADGAEGARAARRAQRARLQPRRDRARGVRRRAGRTGRARGLRRRRARLARRGRERAADLCARVPEGVPAEDAAYATVAAIALHGVRLTEAGLGDVAAVIGLGLVGQLAVELLRGGRLRGARRRPRPGARRAGPRPAAPSRPPTPPSSRPRRRAARPAAAPTPSSSAPPRRARRPLATATAVARERATVSSSATSRIDSPRAPLFAKELRLVVSRSYGPGRYDPDLRGGRHRLPRRLRALDGGPQPRGGRCG